jgi:hypothetical protein
MRRFKGGSVDSKKNRNGRLAALSTRFPQPDTAIITITACLAKRDLASWIIITR